jgi:putative DNA primase/helicase
MKAPSLDCLVLDGLALVPIPLREKAPNTTGWNLRHNCITDASRIGHLSGLNIGLAHAYCTPSPTCALDVDHYPHAKDWLASHDIDLDSLWSAQDAVVILSGKKNSMKLLYRLPADIKPLESKKIVGPDGASALEFRCATKDGKTVQDVLPPSIHPDGHQYSWMGDGDPANIPEIPLPLLTVWLALISNGSRVALRQKPFSVEHHLRPDTPRQIAILKDALGFISADCDYETWRNIVWAILSTGWLCAEDLALEWSETAPERFDFDAFWVLANSYVPDHPNQITVGTVWHHARHGGWRNG